MGLHRHSGELQESFRGVSRRSMGTSEVVSSRFKTIQRVSGGFLAILGDSKGFQVSGFQMCFKEFQGVSGKFGKDSRGPNAYRGVSRSFMGFQRC